MPFFPAARPGKKAFAIAGLALASLLFLFCLPRPLFDSSYSPELLDREGRLLGALASADGQWRFPPGEKINEKFAQAIIEAEDRRFRRHPGVDPLALGRALAVNLRRGRVVSGASTITMQCIRLSRSAARRSSGRVLRRTFFEKAVEAVLSLRLELGYSKNDILALYAANAPFGANVVGLEAASWRWFGRGAEELSWAEAATLAVLPNNPSLIHPGRNRAALRQKRDALLERLRAGGLLDEESLVLAKAEPLPGRPLPLPRLAPHLLSRLVKERGGLPAIKAGTSGGGADFRFRCSLDRGIQERASAIMNRAKERFSANGIMNGACLIINTKTGETAAYVGNVDSPSAADVDIVTARRGSGSLLKPFLYAAMLDSGDILPSSLVSDIPTRVGAYNPENNSRDYLGAVPAGQALARSLNIPAVRSLRVYGVDRFAGLLRDLGLTTLFRPAGDYGLPLILGGAEITLWEITGLYAGLARAVEFSPDEKIFFPPVLFFSPDKNLSGNGGAPFVPAPSDRKKSPPVSPGAAWLTLEALTFVTRPGEEAHWQEYAGSRRVAWKTGTSYGFRDAWAVGITPEWTIGVWIGNATGEGRAELRSVLTAAPVLFELFSAVDSGSRGGIWFPRPDGDLKTLEVCAKSGFPPGPDCFSFRDELVPLGAPPQKSCPYCQTVTLDESRRRRIVLSGNTGSAAVTEKWFALPPAEEWYYRKWNLDYRALPPPEGNAVPDSGKNAMALFNPAEGALIFVPRELDGGEGRVVFQAAHRDAGAVIHWHLDGGYMGSTSYFHEMEARPDPGPHTLTLVDGRGGALVRGFTVIDREDQADNGAPPARETRE